MRRIKGRGREEEGTNRRQGRKPWPLRQFSDGRGRSQPLPLITREWLLNATDETTINGTACWKMTTLDGATLM